jgi:histidine ammonia-lyase
VRERVPPLTGDRSLAKDVESVANMIESGEIAELV